MEKSNSYAFCSFDIEHSILYHEVSNANCGTKEGFVLSMSYFITLMHTYRPKYLIIKILKEPDYFELGLNNFMQNTFFSLIKQLNIKKIAFFVYNETYLSDLKKFEKNGDLEVRLFLDIEDAKQWVISNV